MCACVHVCMCVCMYVCELCVRVWVLVGLRGVLRENKNPTLDAGKKLWFADDRSDSNSSGGTLQGHEVWPGLRREHDPEKPGARNVASTEARARF